MTTPGPGREGAESGPVLEVDGLSKSFLENRALHDFNLRLVPGEIHILVGANGSGKSTLIKVLSGFHVPDEGSIRVGGADLQFGLAESAYRLGCRFVHQDLALVDAISVADNLHLATHFPTRAGTVKRREVMASAASALDRVGLGSVGPRTLVGDLSAAERTGVAVARALQADEDSPPKVLVLDEPTATLPVEEVDHLLAMLNTAADGGLAVLYVTHHLEEVYRLGHSITVLRDGEIVGRGTTEVIDRNTLVGMLGGSDAPVVASLDVEAVRDESTNALTIRALTDEPLRDVSFGATAGEIVGFAGLTGSGRERILGSIFGSSTRAGGVVTLEGVSVPPGRPDRSIAAGMAYVPANRKISGALMALSAQDNLTITDLAPFWSHLRLHKSAQAAVAREWFERLDVRPRDAISQPLERFSGGNQQKILLAKWLRLNPRLLLLDEPTQGVDIGAKLDIHRHVIDAAEAGAIVLVSSTDTEELLALCTRILVIRNGRIFDELAGDRLNEPEIVRSFMSSIDDTLRADRTIA
jgi:ribose transport system ATP-binding protein